MLDPVVIDKPHRDCKKDVKQDEIPRKLHVIGPVRELLILGKLSSGPPVKDVYPHRADDEVIKRHDHQPNGHREESYKKAKDAVDDVERNGRQSKEHGIPFVI